jgi:hypothetical protein
MLLTVVSLCLLGFSAWYVPFRLKFFFGLKRAWPLQVFTALLLAGFYGVLVKGIYTSANPLAAVTYNALGLFFIFQIYLFIYLAGAHALSRYIRKLPSRGAAAAGLLICFGLVALGFFNAQSFRVTEHQIGVRNLARPVTIMHVPDLHLGAQRGEAYLEKIVETINS